MQTKFKKNLFQLFKPKEGPLAQKISPTVLAWKTTHFTCLRWHAAALISSYWRRADPIRKGKSVISQLLIWRKDFLAGRKSALLSATYLRNSPASATKIESSNSRWVSLRFLSCFLRYTNALLYLTRVWQINWLFVYNYLILSSAGYDVVSAELVSNADLAVKRILQCSSEL